MNKREIGKEIIRGLEEIKAWKRGERKLKTYTVAIPKAADVPAIRKELGLSQPEFAGFMGVSLGTLRNWEQGRRQPEGPAIALLFQRGSFTADSTRLVSAVFLGFAPSLIGWSLLELTARAFFSLDRPSLPLWAAAIPVLCNLVFLFILKRPQPEWIGLGASIGFLCGFAVLFTLLHTKRSQWLADTGNPERSPTIG